MYRIINAFPGCGKSTLKRALPDLVCDSDSSKWSKDELWPINYISSLRQLQSIGQLVLASTHKEVIDNLINGGRMLVVYPDRSLKPIYLKNYVERNSPEAFVKLMDNKWDSFINDIEALPTSLLFKLGEGQYLGNMLSNRNFIREVLC